MHSFCTHRNVFFRFFFRFARSPRNRSASQTKRRALKQLFSTSVASALSVSPSARSPSPANKRLLGETMRTGQDRRTNMIVFSYAPLSVFRESWCFVFHLSWLFAVFLAFTLRARPRTFFLVETLKISIPSCTRINIIVFFQGSMNIWKCHLSRTRGAPKLHFIAGSWCQYQSYISYR